jgi:hypothetical protein
MIERTVRHTEIDANVTQMAFAARKDSAAWLGSFPLWKKKRQCGKFQALARESSVNSFLERGSSVWAARENPRASLKEEIGLSIARLQ